MKSSQISKNIEVFYDETTEILYRRLLDQMGDLSEDAFILDIYANGASGGVSGFFTYEETSTFFDEERTVIRRWLADMREAYGFSTNAEMVARWSNGTFEPWHVENLLYIDDYGSETDRMYIKNTIVWAALECMAATFKGDLDEI